MRCGAPRSCGFGAVQTGEVCKGKKRVEGGAANGAAGVTHRTPILENVIRV